LPWAKKLKTLSEKITKAKWPGGKAQVVDTLSSKCEALSSNLNTIKRGGGKIPTKNELV
jgi:hypothetical protein